MSKPASTVSWGSDTNFTSGPETGTPVKIEPSAGAKAQGQVPGQPYRGQRMNWLFNLLGLWTQYLNNLHNDTDFLNQNYTWGAKHEWTATGASQPLMAELTVTGVAAAANLTASADVLAAGNVKTVGEFRYSNGAGVLTPKTRNKMLPLSSGTSINAVGTAIAGYGTATGVWVWPSTSGEVVIPVNPPPGSTLTFVQVGGTVTSGTPTVGAVLYKKEANKTTPSSSVVTAIATYPGAATGVGEVVMPMTPGGGTGVVDTTDEDWYVAITGAPGFTLHWVEIFFTDVGPRNG